MSEPTEAVYEAAYENELRRRMDAEERLEDAEKRLEKASARMTKVMEVNQAWKDSWDEDIAKRTRTIEKRYEDKTEDKIRRLEEQVRKLQDQVETHREGNRNREQRLNLIDEIINADPDAMAEIALAVNRQPSF